MIERISRVSEGDAGYHVVLSNNVEVNFTKDGVWTKVSFPDAGMQIFARKFWGRCTTLWRQSLVKFQFLLFMQ